MIARHNKLVIYQSESTILGEKTNNNKPPTRVSSSYCSHLLPQKYSDFFFHFLKKPKLEDFF